MQNVGYKILNCCYQNVLIEEGIQKCSNCENTVKLEMFAND